MVKAEYPISFKLFGKDIFFKAPHPQKAESLMEVSLLDKSNKNKDERMRKSDRFMTKMNYEYLTGYLTKVDSARNSSETLLKIPNNEVMDIFQKSVTEWFSNSLAQSNRNTLFEASWNEDTEKLTEILSDLLFNTISYHDYAESFYHAFVVGLFANAGYIVESNYENGLGRSDLAIKDRKLRRAIVIELKISKKKDDMEGC